MAIERRKQVRFIPPVNTYAALGKNYSKVGTVKDISFEGLSFEYIGGELSNEDPSKIDIFLVGNVFHLYNVPCKIVYEIEVHVPHVNNMFIKVLTTKRCGIKFHQLNDDDLLQLKLFIESHAGKVAD